MWMYFPVWNLSRLWSLYTSLTVEKLFGAQQACVFMHSTTGCHADITSDLKVLDSHSCCKPLSSLLPSSIMTSLRPLHNNILCILGNAHWLHAFQQYIEECTWYSDILGAAFLRESTWALFLKLQFNAQLIAGPADTTYLSHFLN